MNKKVCGKCGLPKFESDFGRSSKNKDGLQGYCKECMAAYKRQPEQRLNTKLAKRRQRAVDPVRQNQLRRDSHQRCKGLNNARSKTWRKKNPERYKAAIKKWYDAHPEAKAQNRNRRRARLANAVGKHTRQEWDDKLAEYGNGCAYCGCSGKMTRHHVVPLSKGGSDWISNIVPACGSCNSTIGTKTVPPTKPGTASCTATKV